MRWATPWPAMPMPEPAADRAAREPVRHRRIVLLNPNTNAQATQLMVESARRSLPLFASVEGRTVPRGVPLITDEAALAAAAAVVCEFGPTLAGEGFDALVIAGFGDPGLAELRARLAMPVAGIAEAGIHEAGAGGRPYAIVTITPDLHASLRRSAITYGHGGNLASVRFTPGNPEALARDPQRLDAALLEASLQAVAQDGARAIVIGGGPLAASANRIAARVPVPLVEPVAAAVRRVTRA